MAPSSHGTPAPTALPLPGEVSLLTPPVLRFLFYFLPDQAIRVPVPAAPAAARVPGLSTSMACVTRRRKRSFSLVTPWGSAPLPLPVDDGFSPRSPQPSCQGKDRAGPRGWGWALKGGRGPASETGSPWPRSGLTSFNAAGPSSGRPRAAPRRFRSALSVIWEAPCGPQASE